MAKRIITISREFGSGGRFIEYLNQKLDCEVTEEEKMYLILHVNRICSKEKCAEETEDGKGNR